MELSENALIEFTSNPVWKVFKEHLKEMRMGLLEQMAGEDKMENIFRCQGRVEALNITINWPEVQLGIFIP